jgi:hypothetical protein
MNEKLEVVLVTMLISYTSIQPPFIFFILLPFFNTVQLRLALWPSVEPSDTRREPSPGHLLLVVM